MGNKMKKLITAILVSLSLASTGFAGEHTSAKSTDCNNTDLAIGITAGVAAAIVVGVTIVATSTLVGPGIAAGSTVGYAAALSAPFLTRATAMSVGFNTAIMGPIYSTFGYYGSCVIRNVS